MTELHEAHMRAAIAVAELARGSTGDNPWVGCVIADGLGQLVGRGHTQGPGEDHAEIVALHEASARGVVLVGATLYSTLEPCAFHGRTPSCARVIVEHRVGTVVTGMRDPNPRVDGAGARILREAGIVVVEGVCEREVRRQLGTWVLEYHPHDPLRRAHELAQTHAASDVPGVLAGIYGIDPEAARRLMTGRPRDEKA